MKGARTGWLAALALGVLAGRVAWDAAVMNVFDPDVWWVAAGGRALLHSGRVPRFNAWSFSAPGSPWVMHEWALGPLYAAGAQRLGPAWFLLLAVGSVTLAAALLALHARRATTTLPGFAIAAGLPLLFFAERLRTPRPTSLAELFPLALSVLVLRAPFRPLHALLAVALELCWCNAHGSFPLGLVLLFAAALDAPGDRPLRVRTACLAALVTLCNPYGLGLHRLVLGYLYPGADALSVVHEQVVEFWPLWRALRTPNCPDPPAIVALALLAVAGLALLVRSPKDRVRGALALALCAMALRQTRHVELAGILSCVWLAGPLDARLAQRVRALAMPSKRALALAVTTCLLPAYVLAARRTRTPEAQLFSQSLGGPELFSLLARVPDNATVYAPWKPSSVLLWYGVPRGQSVFFDTRNDCYPANVAALGMSVDDHEDDPAVARIILRAYGFNAALLPQGHPMLRALREAGGWREQARAGRWQLWLR